MGDEQTQVAGGGLLEKMVALRKKAKERIAKIEAVTKKVEGRKKAVKEAINPPKKKKKRAVELPFTPFTPFTAGGKVTTKD